MSKVNDKRPNRDLGTDATADKQRPKRKAFERNGAMSTAGLPPNKVGHWVNDNGRNVQRALQLGYEFVHKDWVEGGDNSLTIAENQGTAKTTFAGYDFRTKVPMYAYYMAIDRDLYEEIQAEKKDLADEQLQRLNEKQLSSVPGSYVPKQTR